MISKYREKVNAWFRAYQKDIFTSAIVFFVGLGSFGLGRLSAMWPQKEPVAVIQPDGTPTDLVQAAAPRDGTPPAPRTSAGEGSYVASRSGKYYYLPTCAGAGRIKESNKIWFGTREEAEQKGLKPAANCPGL